jgi:hypothetical protein
MGFKMENSEQTNYHSVLKQVPKHNTKQRSRVLAVNKIRTITVQQQTPKRKQNKNKMKSANNKPGSEMYRTTETVQKRLAANKQRDTTVAKANTYLSCRMNPFRSVNGLGIPDGGNQNYLVTDLLCFNDIVCGTTAGFTIQTLTTMPSTAMIRGNGGAGITDLIIDGTGYNNQVPWFPLGTLTNYRPITQSAGIAVQDPFTAANARIVAIGYRLIYTGTANACAGTITVTPNAVSIEDFSTVNATSATATPPAITAGVTAYHTNNPSGSTVIYAPVSTKIYSMDFTPATYLYTKDSMTYRPEQGCFIRPTHRSDDFKIQPIRDSPVALVFNGNNASTNAGVDLAGAWSSDREGSGNGRSPIFWDNDWTNYSITVSGYTVASTFRWETVFCVEFAPEASSNMVPFTHKNSPTNKPLVTKANMMMNKLPTVSSHFS